MTAGINCILARDVTKDVNINPKSIKVTNEMLVDVSNGFFSLSLENYLFQSVKTTFKSTIGSFHMRNLFFDFLNENNDSLGTIQKNYLERNM